MNLQLWLLAQKQKVCDDSFEFGELFFGEVLWSGDGTLVLTCFVALAPAAPVWATATSAWARATALWLGVVALATWRGFTRAWAATWSTTAWARLALSLCFDLCIRLPRSIVRDTTLINLLSLSWVFADFLLDSRALVLGAWAIIIFIITEGWLWLWRLQGGHFWLSPTVNRIQYDEFVQKLPFLVLYLLQRVHLAGVWHVCTTILVCVRVSCRKLLDEVVYIAPLSGILWLVELVASSHSGKPTSLGFSLR